MNIGVMYFSKSGNTKKIAKKIAEHFNAEAKTIDNIINEKTDILFLGGATYGFDMAPEMKDFLYSINPDLVKNVAIFTTAASKKSMYQKMALILSDRGINVYTKYLHVKSKFLIFNSNRPNTKDLEKSIEFADLIVKDYETSV